MDMHQVTNVSRMTMDPGWHLPYHSHATGHELVLVVEGAIETAMEGGTGVATAGMAKLHPRNIPHQESAVGRQGVAAIEKLTNTKIPRFSGDGSAEGAPAAAAPASEEAPREKRERAPRAKAAPKAAAKPEPTPKAEPAPERAPRADEPRRDRSPRQDRPRREEPRREEPRYEREEEPVTEPKLVADAVPEWNGPMPSFLSFGAS